MAVVCLDHLVVGPSVTSDRVMLLTSLKHRSTALCVPASSVLTHVVRGNPLGYYLADFLAFAFSVSVCVCCVLCYRLVPSSCVFDAYGRFSRHGNRLQRASQYLRPSYDFRHEPDAESSRSEMFREARQCQ